MAYNVFLLLSTLVATQWSSLADATGILSPLEPLESTSDPGHGGNTLNFVGTISQGTPYTITNEAAFGDAAASPKTTFGMSYGESSPNVFFGWIPSGVSGATLQAVNIAELKNALRSASFVNELRAQALLSSACTLVDAHDRDSYMASFGKAIQAERLFRENLDQHRKTIEDDLHKNRMAPQEIHYKLARAAKENRIGSLSANFPTENEVASERYMETVDKVLAVRLEVLMTCKLAALLAQPKLFLNPSIDDIQLLDMIGSALGLPGHDNVIARGDDASKPLFSGLEAFTMASNPYVLGHILMLLIAHMDREAFFGETAQKKFYNFMTLVSATGSETAITMLDEVCDRDRGPHFDIPRQKGRPKGSKNPYYVRGQRRMHRNKTLPALLRSYCDTVELILNGFMLEQEKMHQEMHKFSVGTEPLVDPATNAARLHTLTCRGNNSVCSFDNSVLNPVSNPMDPQVVQQNTVTRNAFNSFSAIASAHLGMILDANAPKVAGVWAEQWVNILTRPAAYTEIMEKTMYWDTTEFLAKNRSTLVRKYKKLESLIPDLMKVLKNGSVGISRDHAHAMFEGLQHGVEAQGPKRGRRSSKITRKNLFKLGVVLFLRDRLTCGAHEPFAHAMERIAKEAFLLQEQKSKGIPAAQRSLMAFLRTNKAQVIYDHCAFDPLTMNYLFLYRFILLGDDPAKTNDRQHAAVAKTKLTTRLIGSKWTPDVLKTMIRGFRKNTYVRKAKQLLLETLDPSILTSVINSFDWIVHTQATLTVNQNSFMFQDVGHHSSKYESKGEATRWQLHQGGLVKATDKQLKDWGKYGIPGSLQNKLRKGQKLPKVLAMDKIPIPDLTKWDVQLNTKWLDALNSYLQHPYGRAALEARDPVALLIKDSKTRLEGELENTIFLGRIVKKPRVSKFKRALSAIGGFFRSLLRAPKQSEYAVWMGVKVDVPQVVAVAKAVNNAAEVVKGSGIYDHVREGFLEIVQDILMANLESHKRVVGYDTFSAIDEQLRSDGMAAAIKRNNGFLAINPEYPNMTEEQRKREFQLSMCMDHCEALWKLVMAFVLPNLQNPKRMGDYEKEMSTTKAIQSLQDQNRVNAFRFGLNTQVDFFDNMLDKGSKDNIKRMKFGAGTWFAYSIALAGRINSYMGNPNLGTMLSFQAPYYGNFIVDWLEQRREARKRAIFAMLTLGFFAAYTFLSVADITQHLNDSGLGPAIECMENLVLGPICPPDKIASAVTSSITTAAQDVMKVGLFGVLTPYLVFPMMAVSVWQILRSEFKSLMLLENSVKALGRRFANWAKKPFKSWWTRRQRMKDSIMKQATSKYENEKAKSQGKEPVTQDMKARASVDSGELTALGLPSTADELTLEMPTSWPFFPLSPPLVMASSSSGW